ncbi:uncharacterized protein LOC127096209 [Lathyrus oleraceus]|uniref:uncharacterized protein LOC127096209 n=1 Tax=Pisum sativum TaxID=3888 RepID=UPI0021D35777|nr:uncharacterized protein LOC127096209 [Pisum sativum]
MLVEETDDWWINTRQVLDDVVEVITWVVFRGEFLRKYFPEDVRGKKEIEFLELNQATVEFSKCIKFENGLRPEIKQAIGYQQIKRFLELVNNRRIYEDNTDKGKKRATDGKRPSKGGAPTPLKCYRCGELGHRVSEYKSDMKKCYKCGKSGYLVADCKENMVTCYNYGEPGHINTHCSKHKKASTRGKVFALTGTQTSSDDMLIRGTCYINNTPLNAIIDIGATHFFITVDCVKRLGLVVSSMMEKCINLICLPLENLGVILGMNLLEFNHVYINCYNKSVRFLTPGEAEKVGFFSTRELEELLEEETHMFMLFTTLSAKSQMVIDELQVVRDLPEVFPDDISDVPPEREVKFSIDLVHGTRPVSLAPYMMSASELTKLKKQLEDLLEKRFMRPSVLPWGALVLLVKKKDDSMRLCVDYR